MPGKRQVVLEFSPEEYSILQRLFPQGIGRGLVKWIRRELLYYAEECIEDEPRYLGKAKRYIGEASFLWSCIEYKKEQEAREDSSDQVLEEELGEDYELMSAVDWFLENPEDDL